MRGMAITCVVPNRNHGRFLRKSLGALLSQTRTPDEIIVIEDCSTDDSLEVIQSIMREAPNMRLIRRAERHGVVANLNLGLSEARGDLVAFLGADDMVLPTFLERTAGCLERQPAAGFATTRVEIRDENDHRNGLRPILTPSTSTRFISADEYRQLLLRGDNYFLGCTTLYRRDLLVRLGGFDPSLGSMCDGVVARRMAARAGFWFVPEVLGIWRIHGQNYSVASVGDQRRFQTIASAAAAAFRAEPTGMFPQGYDRLFVQRARFGAVRLLLANARGRTMSATRQELAQLSGLGTVSTSAMVAAAKAGRIGRAVVLLLLTTRLRPFSLVTLALEPFRRWRVGRSAARSN